ncbi:hypothetical protein Ancab_003920 [Ancistrocladus abbreviatus]
MKRQERRRKFHDAIINMLYPPRPEPEDKQDATINTLDHNFDVNSIPDPENLVENTGSSSSDHSDECGPEKLSRAQRKRIRRKKLKEAATHRRKLIGPVLPSTSEDCSVVDGGATETGLQGVRRYAAEEQCEFAKPDATAGVECIELEMSCDVQGKKKVKQRRMAKKLAKESLRSSEEVKGEDDHNDANCETSQSNTS